MNNTINNPRLKQGLRQTYRSTTVSPFLVQRIIANVEYKKRMFMPGLKLLGGLLASAMLIVLLTTSNEIDHKNTPRIVPMVSSSSHLSSVAVPALSGMNLEIPSLSSLGAVPTLSHIQTPDVFSGDPGDFCIYQHTGEMSC